MRTDIKKKCATRFVKETACPGIAVALAESLVQQAGRLMEKPPPPASTQQDRPRAGVPRGWGRVAAGTTGSGAAKPQKAGVKMAHPEVRHSLQIRQPHASPRLLRAPRLCQPSRRSLPARPGSAPAPRAGPGVGHAPAAPWRRAGAEGRCARPRVDGACAAAGSARGAARSRAPAAAGAGRGC